MIWSVRHSFENLMLMVVNRFDIVLVIEVMIEFMVGRVISMISFNHVMGCLSLSRLLLL